MQQAMQTAIPASGSGRRDKRTANPAKSGNSTRGGNKRRMVYKRPSGNGSRVQDEHGVHVGEQARKCFVPTLNQAAATACAINVWWRQWQVHVRTAAVAWAYQVRKYNADSASVAATRTGIVTSLTRLAGELRAYLGLGLSYMVLGGAIQMLDTEPLLGRMPELMRHVTGEHRVRAPRDNIIAAVLMIVQIGLQCRKSNLASRVRDESPSAMDEFISDCTHVALDRLAHTYASPTWRAKRAP